MKNKIFLVAGVFLVAAVTFWFGKDLYKTTEKDRLSFLAQDNFSVFVRPNSPKLGSDTAKVYIVEFLDPECESCREFSFFVKDLIKEFDGKVQLVVRYAPLHGNSIFAVKILEASRKQGKYWEALNLLFQSQPYWGNHHNPQPELLWTYLPSIGIDVEQIRKDLEDPGTMAMIIQDVADGKQVGVRGTPTFFINGKPLDQFGKEELRLAVLAAVRKNYP